MWRITLLALLCLLAGCTRQKPVIYLDHEWNAYYAKNTCYLYLPKADRDPGLQACLARQTGALQDFEKALLSGIATGASCAGVVLANLKDAQAPPADRGFWRLLISLDDPAGKREPWDLMSPGSAAIKHGTGNAGQTARDVCAIATGR